VRLVDYSAGRYFLHFLRGIIMNTSVAIQVLPKAENNEELIRIVDEVIAYIKSTGFNFFVSPFETTIEGDYDDLMEIVKQCQLICIKAGAPSVMSFVKISFNPGDDFLTIDKKVGKYHRKGGSKN
jgi:uncharacterized protein YqgV (UPF0045/DUF77 family)